MPRVISGRFGGIPIVAPAGEKTRPTTDKVKEALFSILQTRVPGGVFLDLFAGSGQMGIEAVSRGARKVVLVDSGREAGGVICKNLAKLGLAEDVRLLRTDVHRSLRILAEEGEQYDIVFMDPPYRDAVSQFESISKILCENRMLSPGSLVILEHAAADTTPENVMNLTLYRRCKYGTTMLTFYSTDTYYDGGFLST